ncbi:MAG: nucleotidyltransferase domain-containing protein [Candidatus Zambryskibacteria bacterium]|nr:nucleotidyltransferase domain-containing protein [Candidatus Zambryskibacteria bacterium]
MDIFCTTKTVPELWYILEMQTFENLIETLNNHEDIDAVLLVGSRARGEEKVYSDIDLAVIFKENKEKLFSLFQYIDNRPADIFFYDIAQLQKLLTDEIISANTMDGVLISWLEKGNVLFDKSGTLTSFKGSSNDLKKKLEVPATEVSRWDSLINSAYITNKRYFESNNPEYHELLEIKLLQDLYNIFMGYFEFRNIPWTGEKQMLRYLKEKDSEFYNLYNTCLKAQSLQEKFSTYSILVKKVFDGDCGMWDKKVVKPFIKGAMASEERNRLVEYWNNLSGLQF